MKYLQIYCFFLILCAPLLGDKIAFLSIENVISNPLSNTIKQSNIAYCQSHSYEFISVKKATPNEDSLTTLFHNLYNILKENNYQWICYLVDPEKVKIMIVRI